MRSICLFSCFIIGISLSVSGASVDDPINVLRRAQVFYKTGKLDSTISMIRIYLKNHGEDKSSREMVPQH